MKHPAACAAMAICILVPFTCFAQTRDGRPFPPPETTQPTEAFQNQTGELDLTFTERSPLSTQTEIARRLKVEPSSLGDDYDLSKLPYKAYVPTDYDPKTLYGLFVYLGYKNSTDTPPQWQPILAKNHMIFITPVSHYGTHYPATVQMWQTIGLAFDAVYNCKKQFNIDPHRIFLMSWNDYSMQMSLATSDVFTGFLVTVDPEYCHSMPAPGGARYPSRFAPPPGNLFEIATTRAFVLIDDQAPQMISLNKLIMSSMRSDGFEHVMTIGLSLEDDLHYPNMKPDWFEQQALPFLDKASASATVVAQNASPTSQPATSPSPTPTVSEPQHLLSMAQLYLKNGMKEQARTKLQQIIDEYPSDAAAQTAKDLLSQLNP